MDKQGKPKLEEERRCSGDRMELKQEGEWAILRRQRCWKLVYFNIDGLPTQTLQRALRPITTLAACFVQNVGNTIYAKCY